MNGWFGIVLTCVLLLLNALFVGSEFALVSARRDRLEPSAAAGSRPARLALRAMRQVSLVMAGAQLGITMCTLGLGAISEPVIAHLLEPVFDALNVPPGLVHPISFVIATAVVVWAHVVLGEMVPKNLALVGPERAAVVLGPFMLVVVWVLRPVVVTLNAIANVAVRAMRVEPRDEVSSSYTRDEVTGLVDESRREGLLDEHEYGLLSHALEFREGSVDDVLLPRAELVTVPEGVTGVEIEETCAASGFSRFLVVDADDEITGYLHVKDALETDPDARRQSVPPKRVRALPTVPLGCGLYEALRAMQARESHVARVVDTDGTMVGAVMLEDVLEELIGEVAA
ncbi:hemolysin family protein [Solicola gregarius]|uniref:Hemolysin family protein n=1 Tax=Solicola gregarius TaxID=2908642 RepID=A0AA46TJS2_9ACTN|nr:hemolysin family protein [Solicola gregarius]UYM06639.1 hemolysin family protein [Solicola gregarius]